MIEVLPGDGFIVDTENLYSKIIKIGQRWTDKNENCWGTHGGFIVSPNGATMEALWKVRNAHITDYIGKRVLIFRHKDMTPEKFDYSFRKIFQEHWGQTYPFYRPLYILSPVLCKAFTKKAVCTELEAKFFWYLGMMPHWRGVTPDNIADQVCFYSRHGLWQIIYDGVL